MPTNTIEKNKLSKIITPVGSAKYVSAPRASQFDESKIEATVVLTPDTHSEMLTLVNTAIEECEEKLVVEKSKIKLPFKPDTDKDGNETGNFQWKAKTNVAYPPKFYDKNNLEMSSENLRIGNGSQIQLSTTADLVNTGMYKGVVLRLNAIKVLELVAVQSGSPFGAPIEPDTELPEMYVPEF